MRNCLKISFNLFLGSILSPIFFFFSPSFSLVLNGFRSEEDLEDATDRARWLRRLMTMTMLLFGTSVIFASNRRCRHHRARRIFVASERFWEKKKFVRGLRNAYAIAMKKRCNPLLGGVVFQAGIEFFEKSFQFRSIGLQNMIGIEFSHVVGILQRIDTSPIT